EASASQRARTRRPLTRRHQPSPQPRADRNACDRVRRQVRAKREPDRAASLWASRSDAAIARSARRRKALQRLTPRALQLESAKIVADLCREGLGGGAVEGGACGGAGEEGAHRAEAAAEGAQHAFAQGGLRGGAERAGERAGLQRVDAALAGPGR